MLKSVAVTSLVIHRILLQAGADVNRRNKIEMSALHFACTYCHPGTVELLLEAGADKEQLAS